MCWWCQINKFKEAITMARKNKNLHLTLEERKIIESSIENGATKTAISNVLGKDKSTIGKEIKLHREERCFSCYPLDCALYSRCKQKNTQQCNMSCPKYQKFNCKRRDRSPGACNGCSKYKYCHYTKFVYRADKADKDYRDLLVETRSGIDSTEETLIFVGTIIKPLLRKGQSLYTICKNHPEIKLSERTLYNYIESEAFRTVNIDLSVMDLRNQVNRRSKKKLKPVVLKPRTDRKYLLGRKYSDYLQYTEDNPYCNVVQMDTVYNDVSNGPFIQTFKFIRYGFLLCLFHKELSADSMHKGINLLEETLGPELFRKEIEVLLTDRGGEFIAADLFETGLDGTKRTKLFYCDPMCSHQKGSLENNHLELRYICPKKCNLYALGLTSQRKMNQVTSNINSVVKRELGHKSPFQLLEFYSPEFYQKLRDFGIVEVPCDEVLLKPHLLK